MISIPLSLLPLYVVMLLTLAEAAHSQQDWATKWIQEYRITPVQVTQLGAIENQYSDQISQFQ